MRKRSSIATATKDLREGGSSFFAQRTVVIIHTATMAPASNPLLPAISSQDRDEDQPPGQVSSSSPQLLLSSTALDVIIDDLSFEEELRGGRQADYARRQRTRR